MNRENKIAFITTTFDDVTNGPTKFVRLLHNYAIRNKKNILFYSENISASHPLTCKVYIPNYLKLPGIGMLYRIFKYFKLVVSNKDISIVVANNTIYLFLFYFFSKKKTIGFINDNEHLSSKLYFSYSSIRSLVFSFIERISIRNNHLTIVNSKFLKNTILKQLGYDNRIEVLYKGVEIKTNLTLEKHNNDKIFKIIFVKNNFEIGGLLTLLKAVEGLDNIHLNIITSKNVLNSKEEMNLIKENSSIKLHHSLRQEAVFELMKNSHCICIPSNKEALGVANMEGMLNSCLVISTDVGGIPEVLDNGLAGILIPTKDHLKLRKAIIDAHINRERRKEMVKYAHDFVKRFSIEETFINFFKICDI